MPVTNANTLAIKKGQDALFDRGFKTWCENTAVSIRKKMNLEPYDPLLPRELAERLNVIVWGLDDVPGLNENTKSYLSSNEGDEWSAVTVSANNKIIIVLNPTHSAARQASDIMHELAHIILKHESAKLFMNQGEYALRSFDEKQEAEANWFAGCLLLPREALKHCLFKRTPVETAIEEYGVSKQLYTYRQDKTAVKRQYKRW